MFNQNNDEEKKLDWMYKGPTSTVSREEYLLGRPVDKTLEQLNEEEKQNQQGLITASKNRVEHECIPPSIRDFNKLVQAEQVDLSAKLQEDPLVAIKKREEETRRQLLQNPVQLKKLQKALKAQAKKKKNKKKKSNDSDSDLDKKLAEKLLGRKSKKQSKEERQLDTILIHKYEALKDKLTESDLQDILNGKITDSDSSEDDKPKKKSQKKKRYESTSEDSEDEKTDRHKRLHKKSKSQQRRKNHDSASSDNSKTRDYEKNKKYRNLKDSQTRPFKEKVKHRSRSPRHRSSSESKSESSPHKTYNSDDSDSSKNKKIAYGLVTSDGRKIPLSRKQSEKNEKAISTKRPEPPPVQERRAHKLTEEEKEKLRREMMKNAVERDKERERNVKKYRAAEEKEKQEQNFEKDFIHKQLLKSANNSSVESRIKSNLNNIQRSGRDMDRNFSRR